MTTAIDTKIALSLGYARVPSGNDVPTDLWETDAGIRRFHPTSNLTHALELADKYSMTLHFGAYKAVTYNKFIGTSYGDLKYLPKTVCSLVVILEDLK